MRGATLPPVHREPRQPLPTSVDVGYLLALLLPFAAVFVGVYAIGQGHRRHGLGIIALSLAVLTTAVVLLG